MEKGSQPGDAHAREYLRVIRKHTWLIAACCVVVVTAVGVRTYLTEPVYQATAKVLIERGGPRVVNIQEVMPTQWDPWDPAFFQTQVQFVRSRPVVQRAIDTLGPSARKAELSQAKDPVAAYLAGVTVAPIKNTRFIEVRAEDPHPQAAAEKVNALANAYVAETLEQKLTAAREALAWLTANVSDLKQKVNESELALQRYKEQAGLAASADRDNLVTKKLADFNSTYVETKAKRLEMETRLAEVRRPGRDPDALLASPAFVDHPLIQRLKGQAVELEVQRSKTLKVYKDKHPEAIKIQTQIEELYQKLREEVVRLARSLETEYNVLKAREAAMLAAVNQYHEEAQQLAKKEIQSGILKREADSNQQLYEMLLKRFKEVSLGQGLETNHVRVVEAAVVPTVPVKPRKLYDLSLALAGGLAVGLALAFFREYMDDTVRTGEQLEAALGVPVFAVIPVIPSQNPSRATEQETRP